MGRKGKRRRIKRFFIIGLPILFLGMAAFLFFRDPGRFKRMVHVMEVRNRKAQWEKEIEETLGEGEIPQSLLDLARRNPEAEEFVNNYTKNIGRKPDFDLSWEVKEGEIPLFLQWDERWGYESYGDDYLAVTGCGPTCLSMVYVGLTGDTGYSPYEMAKLAEKKGYYVEGAGSSWEMMTELGEKLGLDVKEPIFDEEHILKALQNGHPIICIMRKGDFTDGGHFIVLTGVAENGEIMVNDPNSIINSEKTWDLEKLMKQMRNLWEYSYT